MTALAARFGHTAATLRFWRRQVRRAALLCPTPFYLFSADPVAAALDALQELSAHAPVEHWYSCKTQPLPALLRYWRQTGRGIEVVSEYELLAALAEGFDPERILVNGPAKHRWLARHTLPRLRVHIDSLSEATALLPMAQRQDWRLGMRFAVAAHGAGGSAVSQFGLDEAEAAEVLRLLRRRRREPESVHFHAGTQIDSARTHLDALQEVARRCARLGFRPRYVDCGGGLPAPHTLDGKGRRIDRRYSLPQLGRGLAAARRWFPDLVAYWLENGRFVTAGSGVLVVSVLDCKQRGGQRYLICDGGRTNQALLSQWEAHACLPVRPRRAASTPCVVTGPTCMAFDVLAEQPLPTTLRAGDALMWMDAGAYAIPWENRFSHGLAGVLWHQDDQLTLARHPEGFAAFWQNWNGPAGAQRSLAAAAASKAK